MKKTIILFFITNVIVLLLLVMGCAEGRGSSGGGGGSGGGDDTAPDPFAGIMYRDMVLITGGIYIQTDGTNSFTHTISNFLIGRYEVTYELWYTVRQWALTHGYTFANAGREGSAGGTGTAPSLAKYEPVTRVNWRDAMVWCNAYSEMAGLTPVYTYSSATIKDSRDTNATACDNAVCNWSANGYRFPTEGEWQFVASNKGGTPYNYLSGATTYCDDVADVSPANGIVDGKDSNDLVAVYCNYWDGATWEDTGVTKTANVGTKNANQLTIFDMSGNVWEWCWDWYASYPDSAQTDYRGPGSGLGRIILGGSWGNLALECQVGWRYNDFSYDEVASIGFRIARSN